MQNQHIILHIGPPKTGTTTLQEKVFPHLDSICFMGKPWWNPRIPYDTCVALHHAIDSVTKADESTYDAEAAARAVSDWLAHAPMAAARPDGSLLPRLLSEERLVMTDTVGFDTIARRLKQLFPKAEIVYTARDRIKSLSSYHSWHYARAWTDRGFSDWLQEGLDWLAGGPRTKTGELAKLAIETCDWTQIENSFGAHFSSVRRVEFALMHSDPQSYLEQFFGFTAPEFTKFARLSDTPLNASRARPAAELHRTAKKAIRLWNRMPFGKIDEKPEYIGDTPPWQRLERLAQMIPMSEAKLKPTPDDKRKIASYFAGRDADKRISDH